MKRKGIKRKGGNEAKKRKMKIRISDCYLPSTNTVVLEVPQWYYCFCFGSRSLRVKLLCSTFVELTVSNNCS